VERDNQTGPLAYRPQLRVVFLALWRSPTTHIPMRRDFPPIAAGRGLPEDAFSEAIMEYADVVARYPTEIYGARWVTLSEIQAINWGEPIESRIVISRRG
jgi:hypothetical protein